MTTPPPNYDGTAIIEFHEAGFGEGMWRAACPIGCCWRGSDYEKRADAVASLDEEKKGHKCVHASAFLAAAVSEPGR